MANQARPCADGDDDRDARHCSKDARGLIRGNLFMMRDETTAAAIRACAASRHLPDAHTEKWLAMDTPSRMGLLDIAERLKLRTGQLVAAIDLLDEIEIREGVSPAKILLRGEVQ